MAFELIMKQVMADKNLGKRNANDARLVAGPDDPDRNGNKRLRPSASERQPQSASHDITVNEMTPKHGGRG